MNAYPALPAFAMALAALFLKTTLTTFLQIVSRFRSRSFLVAEDAAMVGARVKEKEAPLVQRCTNIWRNDVENLPLFLALALTYVLLGASKESAQLLFGLYVAIRYAHTVIYLRGLQPWRAISFLAGLAVCWIIAVRIVLMLLQ